MSSTVLVLAVFLASTVEMVEALTIVLAAASTRGWRSALEGVAVGLATLGALVAVFGPAIVHYVPIYALRIFVGALLLVFGMQWLRKAILRSAGLKAMHNEDEVFAREVKELSQVPSAKGSFDPTGFAVAFKGVFLEGLEVVIIVISLGSSANRIGLAALSALAAALLVAGVGAIVSKQLSRVPENKLKMGVGLMLVAFGTFWSGEGLKVHWPGSDLSLLGLLVVYGAITTLLIILTSQRKGSSPRPALGLMGDPGENT